jgi:hypothetical protein
MNVFRNANDQFEMSARLRAIETKAVWARELAERGKDPSNALLDIADSVMQALATFEPVEPVITTADNMTDAEVIQWVQDWYANPANGWSGPVNLSAFTVDEWRTSVRLGKEEKHDCTGCVDCTCKVKPAPALAMVN